MTTYLMLLAGLGLLILGGELLVRGAVAVATALGVSPLLIGLTRVGVGTSTPELVTSVQAALAGSPGVAVGNVVGSNIANILLILGVAALIRPVAADPRAFRRDGAVLAAATALALGILLSGDLGRPAGALLTALLAGYLVLAYRLERGAAPAVAALSRAEAAPPRPGLLRPAATAAAGLVLVILGAGWLVEAAITLAQGLGVSDTLIGLTLVAVGTSLPELTVTVTAALRGQGAVAFGNIVGSNIYNILGILGVTALVRPIAVPPEIAAFDGWVMAAATLALIVAAATGGRVNRAEGAALLAAYAAYLAWLALTA